MKRPLLALAALLAVASTTIAQAAAPLPTLLVQRSDLKTSYSKPLGAGYLSGPRIPNGRVVPAKELRAHGYVRSYAVEFQDMGAHPQPQMVHSIVQESIDKYRSSDGAKWGLAQVIIGRFPQATGVSFTRVGSESKAYSLVLPEPPGRALQVFFRRGRYVVNLFFGAVRGPLQPALLAMARLIDKRIVTRG